MFCACGVTFSFHHCKGKLQQFALGHKQHGKKCCKGKMSKSCCKDKEVTFKKGDDKGSCFFIIAKKNIGSGKIAYFQRTISTQKNYPLVSVSNFHLRPPPFQKSSVPLFIINSIFRI